MPSQSHLRNLLLVLALAAGVAAGVGVRSLIEHRPTAAWRRAQHEAYVQQLQSAGDATGLSRTVVH